TLFFFVGGFFAVLIRLELLTPQGDLFQAETYNKLFTMHGVMMIFFLSDPFDSGGAGNLPGAYDDWSKRSGFPANQSVALVRLHDRRRIHLCRRGCGRR